jgi:hypothetical protein
VLNSTPLLTLVDPRGVPLGTLPPLPPVGSPWWKDISTVVEAARENHGIDVTILRLLSAERPAPPGGAVHYLAEYDGPPLPGLAPVDGRPDWTGPHPLRMPWAEPGGPAASLAWAGQVLAGQGRTVTCARQMRTWNLSSIWWIDTDRGPVWLKEVPPFMAHEGVLLAWLDHARWNTTALLGADGHRMLIDDIPGTDRYDAGMPERHAMMADLLAIQTDSIPRLLELRALGVPTETGDDFREQAETALPQWMAMVSSDDRVVLGDLVGGLAKRFAALADCGLPDTLAHCDFHPGNVRSDGTNRALIDWGDSRIAHPAIDLIRMRDSPGAGPPEQLCELWCAHWRNTVPGSDPERAIELMAQVTALREALVYGLFLRSIEPTEHPYHDADVPLGLDKAIRLHRTSQPA